MIIFVSMLERIASRINDVIWSPALVILLVGAGLYFTIATRFVQVRKFGLMHRLLFKKKGGDGAEGMSAFESFCVAVSGRVGTGNIVGVATAIAIGGPGAVFWMWVTAFFGVASSFVESTLAQIYKFPHKGGFRGGPFSYIDKGLKSRWLAVVFAVVTIIACGVFFVSVQANGVASASLNSFGIPPLVSGLVLAFLVGLVVIGGISRIAKVASLVAPFMAVGYILVALTVIAFNWREIPDLFALIFTNAFGINPLCGGILGSTIMMGVKRGVFSNEAGQGTGPIPSASAIADHPAEQGLVQGFSVIIDTLVVCTATALMILSAGTYNIIDQSTGAVLVENAPGLGANYVGFAQAAVDSVFGGFGGSFISVALVFFVFSSMVVYYFYAESSLIYLCGLGKKGSAVEKVLVRLLQVILVGSVVFGSVKDSDFIWTLCDIGVGMMAWINIIAILLLSPKAFRSLRDFEEKNR